MTELSRIPSLAEEVGGGIPLPESSFRSLGELIAARAAADPNRAAVRSRTASGKWVDLTWGQLDDRRRAVAAGLASLGVKRGDTVAVVSHNSAEMLIAELAVVSLGAVSAPIFPEYTADVTGAPSVDYRATGSGTVVVLREGKRFDGKWSREGTGMYRFTDAAGAAITLKQGRTWIHIVPADMDLTG